MNPKRIHDEYEAIAFEIDITEDRSAAQIVFRTASDHEAIVQMAYPVLLALTERLSALVSREAPPSDPR